MKVNLGQSLGIVANFGVIVGILLLVFELNGELPAVDLSATVTKVDIPIFVFQGAEDIRTPANLVQQFLDGLDAPRKELVLLEGGGHDLEFQINDALRAQLESRVRPLAMD